MVGIDIYRNPKNNLGCEDFTVSIEKINHRSIQLTFPEKYKDFVVSSHIPYVVKRSKSIKKENKALKLYALQSFNGDYSRAWPSRY